MDRSSKASRKTHRLGIWQITPAHDAPNLGFIVAPTNQPECPIALIYSPGGWSQPEALQLAVHLRDNPTAPLDAFPTKDIDGESAYILDLRTGGKLPLPLCLFGNLIRRVNAKGKHLDDSAREYWPRCPFRARQMVSQVLPAA